MQVNGEQIKTIALDINLCNPVLRDIIMKAIIFVN